MAAVAWLLLAGSHDFPNAIVEEAPFWLGLPLGAFDFSPLFGPDGIRGPKIGPFDTGLTPVFSRPHPRILQAAPHPGFSRPHLELRLGPKICLALGAWNHLGAATLAPRTGEVSQVGKFVSQNPGRSKAGTCLVFPTQRILMYLGPTNSQVLRPPHTSGVSNGGVGSSIESRSQEPLGGFHLSLFRLILE